jgi:hypothetical protein
MRRIALLLVAISLSAILGCEEHPAQPTEAPPKKLATGQPSLSVSSDAEQQTEPRHFGFIVQRITPGWCCSGEIEKPKPDGTTIVEGLTMDSWRFELICDHDELIRTTNTYVNRELSKADLYRVKIAAFTSGAKEIDLYTFFGKEPIAECFIESRLDRARDVTPVKVVSSNAFETQSSRGYEVIAESKNEVYKLRCTQGGSSECESVAPGGSQAVRDGSEIRLCNNDLKVLSTLTIVGERSLQR